MSWHFRGWMRVVLVVYEAVRLRGGGRCAGLCARVAERAARAVFGTGCRDTPRRRLLASFEKGYPGPQAPTDERAPGGLGAGFIKPGILRVVAQPTPCSDLPRIRRPACHPARVSSKRVVLCLSQMEDDDGGRYNREGYESRISHDSCAQDVEVDLRRPFGRGHAVPDRVCPAG